MADGKNGLLNQYDLIDSVIIDLNNLTVRGVDNLKIVLGSIQKLAALKNGLKKEEEARENHHDQQGENVSG